MRPDGRRGPDLGAEPEGGTAVDPLADLLFTLIAAVLPAIFLLAPLLRAPSLGEAREVRPPASAAAQGTAPVEVRVDGRGAATVIAGAGGLRLMGDGGRLVGLDAIADDPSLIGLLDRLREDDRPLLLVVEPDGLEAAFLFEPVLAAHGPRDLREVRATDACAATRDAALAAACRPRAAVP